jgi:hypothetical protein
MKLIGMVSQGLPQGVDGQRRDTHVFAMLRGEWAARVRRENDLTPSPRPA